MQYSQPSSDGAFWQTMDPSYLVLGPLTGPHWWLISVNSDLWTSVAGYNQDIGIMVSGGAYGVGTLVAWKESGGFAGIYSPNAAFLETAAEYAG